MTLVAHQESTAGRRESNQDRFCLEATTFGGRPALVLAVADGMGGMQAGDRAAELAIEEVRQFAHRVVPSLPESTAALREGLEGMVQAANSRIWDFGQQESAAGLVGTTLVCAIVLENLYLVANTGDSRCYYVNDHEARLLTEDHSQVRELVRSGAMTEAAAKRSPYRSQLTSSLGEPDRVRVDIFPAGPRVGVIDEGCALVLCSDGLHGEVTESDLAAHLHGTRSLIEACRNLVSLAYQRGSSDNITLVAAEPRPLTRRGPRQARLPAVEKLRSQTVRRPPAAAPSRPGSLVPGVSLAAAAVLALAGGWVAFGPVFLRSGAGRQASVSKSGRAEGALPIGEAAPPQQDTANAAAKIERLRDDHRPHTDRGQARESGVAAGEPDAPAVPADVFAARSEAASVVLASPDAPLSGGTVVSQLDMPRPTMPPERREATKAKDRSPVSPSGWQHSLTVQPVGGNWFSIRWRAYPIDRAASKRGVHYEGYVYYEDQGRRRKIASIDKTHHNAARFQWKPPDAQHDKVGVFLMVTDGSGHKLESVSTEVIAVR